MTSFVVDNNAESTVSDNPLTDVATTLNLASGGGASFPSAFPYVITVWNEATYVDPTDDSEMEVMIVTGRSTDTLTVTRAQESTSGVAHALGSRVAMLVTAGIFNDATYGISTKIDTIETAADVTDTTNVEAAGAVMDSDVSEAEGYVRKTGVGTYEAIKSNLSAVVAPTVSDDSDDGYAINSDWIDLAADKSYKCLDATVGAAVWTETSAGAAGAHLLGGASHTADSLANLNTKVSDATLIDTADARLSDVRTPTVHETSHESGGSDELDFDQLADGTTYKKFLATERASVAANVVHKTSNGSDHSFINQSVVNGASPILSGTNITDLPANNVDFNVIGAPTYQTAQDWFNIIQTAGIISGFTLSNSRVAAELDVASGSGIVKTTDSPVGPSVSFDFAGMNNVTLTADNINYIYLDYNLGTPQVVATTNRASIELNRQFCIGKVFKDGVTLHILNAGVNLPNLARTEHERLVERDGFTHISGAITSKIATLDLGITEGVWYFGHNRLTTNSLDTSGAGTFEYTHYGAASWIVDDATAGLVDATHYNAGTDALGNLTINAYGTQWVYIDADSHAYIIYGTENGSLAVAEAATPPTSIPLLIDTMGELIAKIIVRQTNVIISIGIVHDIKFTTAGVQNHNDTGGIQGGAADDYFHLTSVQETDLTDGNASTAHYHVADRARADHTGTQAASTISDFDTEVENNTKVAGIEALADVTDADNVASSIHGVAGKATPVDADELGLIDSAAANALKVLTWANIKATMKTYMDTLYAAVLEADDNYVTDAEKTIIGNTSGANTGDEDDASIATIIVGTAAKATPIDADTVPLIDSADASSLKEVTWANIKATLKTYFDTLYNLYVHPNHTGDVTSVADGATTIAAGAVDIAMLANGTDGELITWDAAGSPDTVAVGTATHVLTSNGVGVAPTFQASAGGSSLVNQILYAEAAYLPDTNPATLTEEPGTTTYGGFSHLDFDDTTSETAIWRIPVPDYDGGNIVVTAFSKVAATPAGAVTLQYNILTIGLANSEAFDTAVLADTTVNISHSLNTTELLTDVMIASVTIDPANVFTDDLLVIGISRDVANDTLVGDGELVGIMLEYTRA